jgi:hypothetical protein
MKPTYVTFEQAKAFKAKGFDILQRFNYNKEGDLWENENFPYDAFIDNLHAPEQHQVVEWLRVNHGIWISIYHKRHSENKHYGYVIKQSNGIETKLWGFYSPQEAYSSAFDYILNDNLI